MFCEKMTPNIEIKRCFAEVVLLLLEHPSLPVPQVAIQMYNLDVQDDIS